MPSDALQIDIDDLLHYQNAPDFIGPRLPRDHPAYIRYLVRQRTDKEAK